MNNSGSSSSSSSTTTTTTTNNNSNTNILKVMGIRYRGGGALGRGRSGWG